MQNSESLKQQCLNQLIGQQQEEGEEEEGRGGRHSAKRQVTAHRETTGGHRNDRADPRKVPKSHHPCEPANLYGGRKEGDEGRME